MVYSEAEVSGIVRLDADMHECLLMRNNVGAYKTSSGRWVRYGLANESKTQNKQLKSSDFIGIRRVVITESMVGQVIGQFVARECKHSQWSYEGSEEEEAQLAFIELMRSYGADADFATGKGSFGDVAPTRAKRLEPHNRTTMILEAAYALVAEGRKDRFTMADVARRTAISHSALRHYFANRAALLAALLDFSRVKGDPVVMARICVHYAEVIGDTGADFHAATKSESAAD